MVSHRFMGKGKMKQTIEARQERPLLNYAVSKLNPDIFSHPVWVRFSRQKVVHAPAILDQLLSSAESLQQDEPGSACQILLVCAVYQNLSEQDVTALETIRYTLDLAKRADYTSGVLWANWGATAICFQHEDFNQAAGHLKDLEATLNHLNEWVLADFVNVIRQSVCQSEMTSARRQAYLSDEMSSDDLLHFTCVWFQNWGSSSLDLELDGQSKREHWHAPGLFHKWGLKLNNHTNRERQPSVWSSIRSLLRLQQYHSRPAPGNGEEKVQQKPVEVSPDTFSLERVPKPEVDIPATEITSPRAKGTHKRKSSYPKKQDPIALTVQMLGTFSLTIGDTSPKLPASRALSVFKYLLLHHKQKTPRDILMDTFWPDAGLEAARNNLNVAMHNLRQALRSVTRLPVISFEDGVYYLEPSLEIWLDVEEFDRCVKEGRQLEAKNELATAIAEYEISINLYRGDLLADSPYEEWTVLERERLRVAYLDTLDHLSQIIFSQERYSACVALCQLILSRDICREDAHCRLMRCYTRLGQFSLALRQYQVCVEALQTELQVNPTPETTWLYEKIHHHEKV
jgi:DNA-binding SARP family transcriptional activator